jgi:hypothetical protein
MTSMVLRDPTLGSLTPSANAPLNQLTILTLLSIELVCWVPILLLSLIWSFTNSLAAGPCSRPTIKEEVKCCGNLKHSLNHLCHQKSESNATIILRTLRLLKVLWTSSLLFPGTQNCLVFNMWPADVKRELECFWAKWAYELHCLCHKRRSTHWLQ